MMKHPPFAAAILLVLGGCAADPTTNTTLSAYGYYDDISYLECTGHTLNAVSECQVQQAREALGAEPMSQNCRWLLNAWEGGTYRERCGEMR